MRNYKKVFLLICFIIFGFFLAPASATSTPPIIRLGGNDRYGTAVKISQDSFTQSDYVVLTSGRDFPDALCAAPLAKMYNAPILLTQGNSLGYNISQEIIRLGARYAFIVGGTGVISSDVENQLKALNIVYTRIGGVDRYDTSVKVAEIIGSSNGIVLASGQNFPDALSIASIAAAKQMPILLTTAKTLPDSVKSYINTYGAPKSYIIGGISVISSSAAAMLPNQKRLSGSDRYETNLAVVNEFINELNFSSVYLATGRDFADALGGSAAAAKISAPLILTDNNVYKAQSLFKSKYEYISGLKVLGGTGVISDALVQKTINPHKVVLGYATRYGASDNESYKSLVNYSSFIDGVATYTYVTDGYGNMTGTAPADILNYAKNNNKYTLALITNEFDGQVAKSLLENSQNRRRLIDNILSALKANNYKGVNIDFEGLFPSSRPHFTAFMSELYSTLNPLGFTVTVAVPAKTGDNPSYAWSGAFDYAQIGRFSDQVVLMTYDEHWSGGPAGPIASIGWVQKVVEYALTVMPAEKIVLGIAAYGYDWPSNGSSAKSLSISKAYSTASSKGAQIKWDQVSKSPYFNYTDSSGIYHTVWFENSTSIEYKLDIVNNYDLHGIAIWRLGLENSDFWTAIATKFNR